MSTTEQYKQVGRKRKTVRLEPSEKKSLKDFAKKYEAFEDAAEALGVNRSTLFRIIELGRGSSESIAIIREKLNVA